MGTIREAIEGSKTTTIKWIFLLRIAIRAGSEDSAGEEISEDALDVAIRRGRRLGYTVSDTRAETDTHATDATSNMRGQDLL